MIKLETMLCKEACACFGGGDVLSSSRRERDVTPEISITYINFGSV